MLPKIDFLYFYSLFNSYLDWVFIILLSISFVISVYNVFKKMVLAGFTKESSLDYIIITFIITITPFAYFFYKHRWQETWFIDFFLYNYFLIPLFFFFLYLLFKHFINKWSGFKLLDIYGLHLLPMFSLSYLYLFFRTLNYSFIFVFLILTFTYFYLKALYLNKFNSLFKILVCEKDDEISFIGGVGIIFVFCIGLLSIFNIFYTKGFSIAIRSLSFYTYLIFLFYLVLLFYKRLKFFNIKCHLAQSFWENKKKYFLKKEKESKMKLID